MDSRKSDETKCAKREKQVNLNFGRIGWAILTVLVCGKLTLPVEAQDLGATDPWRVAPSVISTELGLGECHDDAIVLTAPAVPVPSLDLALVMDVTGSMEDEIEQVRAEATALVERVQLLVPDTRFAVVSLADYAEVQFADRLRDIVGNAVQFGRPGDSPWQLEQPFTADAALVQSAVNRIVLLHGGDNPEAYLRALDEAARLEWRPDARRIILLFGDSEPHTPDPGRDATVDTADDLETQTVLQRLNDQGIRVIAVQAQTTTDIDFYRNLADSTGGQWYALVDAADSVTAIGNLVEQDVALLRQLTLRPAIGYSSWVTWTPEQYAALRGEEQVSFALRICRPENATVEKQSFDLQILAAGVGVETVLITVLMPSQWWLWAIGLLLPLLIGAGLLAWLRRPRTQLRERSKSRGPSRAGPRPPSPGSWSSPPKTGPDDGRNVTHGRDRIRR